MNLIPNPEAAEPLTGPPRPCTFSPRLCITTGSGAKLARGSSCNLFSIPPPAPVNAYLSDTSLLLTMFLNGETHHQISEKLRNKC